MDFRPTTAQQRVDARTALNAEKKSDLRASHWSVGQSTSNLLSNTGRNRSAIKTMPAAGQRPSSAFVTQAMLNYKWV